MKTNTWQSGLSHSLAKQIRQRRWSPKRTLLLAGATLLLLYAGLLAAMPTDAAAARPASDTAPVAPQQAEPTAIAEQRESDPEEGVLAEGAVSPGLLAEFDRLAADSEPAAQEQFGGDTPGQSGAVSTIFASLLLIVAAIYGGVWLYRRYTGGGAQGGLAVGGGLLAVQESHAIGPNQKLHLVRVGEELLLIGATDQSISFLARCDGQQADSGGFSSHLQNAMSTEQSSGLDLSEGLQRLRSLSNSGFRGGGDD